MGYALFSLPSHSEVPWHRVVNAKGEISRRTSPGADLEQRYRLEREGVAFDLRGRIDLERFRWDAVAGGK